MKKSYFIFLIFLIFFVPVFVYAEEVYLTTTGAGTWTRPANTNNLIIVDIWAGGGQGGGTNSKYRGGGGGGGGGYQQFTSSDPKSTWSYYVGAGGSTGISTADGQDGENSWFNDSTVYYANGGKGGKRSGLGGAGGLGSCGDGSGHSEWYCGGNGGSSSVGEYSGGGGGGAGSIIDGSNGSGFSGGAGGSNLGGAGGSGACDDGSCSQSSGFVYSAGGGGGYRSAGVNVKGSNGANGLIRITYTLNTPSVSFLGFIPYVFADSFTFASSTCIQTATSTVTFSCTASSTSLNSSSSPLYIQDSGDVKFTLAIILVFIFLGFVGYIFNRIFKPKSW